MKFFKCISFLCVAAMLVSSCASTSGSKKADQGKGSSQQKAESQVPDDVMEIRRTALAVRESCKEAEAQHSNPRDWEEAENILRASESNARNQKYEEAKAGYAQAAQAYESILQAAQANLIRYSSEKRAEIEKKIAECEEKGLSALEKNEFDIGFVLFSTACQEMDSGEYDAKALAKKFDESESHIDIVLSAGAKNAALAAKSESDEAEKSSRAAKADVAAKEIFADAEGIKRSANSDFEAGRYSDAAEKYALAAKRFNESENVAAERREKAAKRLEAAKAATEESKKFALEADEISPLPQEAQE